MLTLETAFVFNDTINHEGMRGACCIKLITSLVPSAFYINCVIYICLADVHVRAVGNARRGETEVYCAGLPRVDFHETNITQYKTRWGRG